MQKLLIAPLLLAMLAGGPVYAQISDADLYELEGREIKADREQDLEYFNRLMENYFETDTGMTKDDYARLQTAEGYVREGKLDKGLELLRLLRIAYPESLPVGVQMAKAYMGLQKPEQSLLILEDTIKQLEPLEDEDQPVLLALVMMEVNAYQVQRQPAHAMRVLQSSQIKPALLSEGQQEDYYLTLAKLLVQIGQHEAAYQHIKAIIATGQTAVRTRQVLLQWGPMLAEEHYKLGTAAFREGNYTRTQQLALTAYNLNPVPVKYSQLLALAQGRILDQVNIHFKNALPALTNAIRNMRFALEQEDYNSLYHEYLRLQEVEDVAFFMNRDYEGYLPVKMQSVLREVEVELKTRGFDF